MKETDSAHIRGACSDGVLGTPAQSYIQNYTIVGLFVQTNLNLTGH